MRISTLAILAGLVLLGGSDTPLRAQCLADLPVSTRDGVTEVEICLGSSMTTVRMKPGTQATPYFYAITDSDGNVLAVSYDFRIDFGAAPPGVCRVYGVSWWGIPQMPIGSHISEAVFSDFCYEVSPNYVEVTRILLGSGTVATSDGASHVYTCPGDDISDVVNFSYDGSSQGGFTYIITDPQYNILGIPPGSSQDFEGAGEGVCLVWGLNYMGELVAEVGDNALTDELATGCFGLSENMITVVRAMPEVSGVLTTDGDTEVTLCVGDGTADEVSFAADDDAKGQIRYVVTDEEGMILGLPGGNAVDFEGAGAGVCLVWAVSFTGDFLLTEGQDLTGAAISSECYDISEGYVTVTRKHLDGGTVQMPSGETVRYTCTQDGSDDLVTFESMGATGPNFTYIITSPSLEILGIPPGNSQNFDGAPPGTCLVWGLSYTGELTAAVGDNAGEIALSDECYDLSDNYIEVIRDVPEGGTVSMPNGENKTYTCTQDTSADVVMFQRQGTSNSKFIYVITSPTLEILGLEPNDRHDFNNAPPGTCWVWGMAYTGQIIAEVGDNVADGPLTDDCFDLSDNFIEVIRDVPDGGRVSTPPGATTVYTCTQDGKTDRVPFSHAGASNSKYIYVITSPTLEILGITSESSHDFDGAPPGTCWVWGLAYTGDLLAAVGANAGEVPLASDCYDLSDNFIEVIRDRPEGGTVRMPSGDTVRMTCTQDGTPDVVMFENTGSPNAKYAYIITSPTLEVLGVPPGNSQDFDGAPSGICWVWGVSYTGNLTVEVGDNASEIALSSDCYDLSDNYIEVIREVPDGGTVQLAGGGDTYYTCTQDGTDDVLTFESAGAIGPNFTYVITSPSLEILGIPDGNTQNFDGAPPGTCLVWGLSYTGALLAEVGQNAGEVDLSDECFDLSDNYIEVIRDVPDGGTVRTPSGDTKVKVYTCTQDGEPDVVEFEHEGHSNSKYIYVITSPALEILGIETNDYHDFDDAPPGTCWVWGMAYTGAVIAAVGDNVADGPLTDDCFDLSDNYIEVVRDVVDGGQVQMPGGGTKIYTCTQDGVSDFVEFEHSGASNSKYVYIITSPTLRILGITTNDGHDFDDAPPGTCWVWGLAYTGRLLADVGENAGEIALSNDCYDLSDNYIEVIRDVPDGGTVSTSDGATEVQIIAGDGAPDEISFESAGQSNSKYAYVITDDNNTILGLPPANAQDFEGAGEGVCRVWGLSYTGELLAQVGDDAASVQLSDGCFDLSDNYVEIVRTSLVLSDANAESRGRAAEAIQLTVVNPTVDRRIVGVVQQAESAPMWLIIHDLQGNMIGRRQLGEQVGTIEIDWAVDGLAPGMYVLTVYNGQVRQARKVLVH